MSWHQVAQADDVPEDEGLCVKIDGHAIALFRVEGEIYAIDDLCSHAEASLAAGFVDGGLIECPLHQACFDIRTGKVMTGPATEDVRSYRVKIEGGAVLVER
ncbi:MAG: nitrite reductase small subunit NirD [Caulobacterales bacterium]|nr:nitrite reductase small subunit NirD [Caulobacterales bacterium]